MRTGQIITARRWLAASMAVLVGLLLLTFGQSVHAQSASSQKAGSVLFYNIYTSSSFNTAASDTLITLTNTADTRDIRVHLFFVDSFTCTIADSFIYLSKSQTARFLTSDVDPDVRGYIVAVAVNEDGVPVQHNYLLGGLKVKQALGATTAATHTFEMSAVAFAKLNNQPVPLSIEEISADLVFDGGNGDASYEQLPGELAISNFESPSTADTRMIVYSPTTSLYADGISGGRLFILYFDEMENSFSAMVGMNCWLQGRLTMIRNLPLRIPGGQTGWLKMIGLRDDQRIPLLGAVIRAADFSGGHNLHQLAPFPSFTMTVPVFPPGI